MIPSFDKLEPQLDAMMTEDQPDRAWISCQRQTSTAIPDPTYRPLGSQAFVDHGSVA